MTEVGSAYIDIRGDGSGLPKDVETATRRASKGAEVTVTTELDAKGLPAAVDKAAERAEKNAKVEFKYQPPNDAKRLDVAVEKAANAAEKKADVDFRYTPPDAVSLVDSTAKAARRAEKYAELQFRFEVNQREKAKVAAAAKGAAGRANTEVEFTADPEFKALSPAAKAAALRARTDVKFEADADFGDLAAKAAAAARLAKTRIKVEAYLDRKGFKQLASGAFLNKSGNLASIGELQDALGGLGDTAAKSGGMLSKMGPAVGVVAVAAINALPYVTALGAGLVALVGQVAYAAGGLAAGGAGIFASIGLAAAAVKIGLTGVGDAFSAVSKAQEEQAKTGKVSEATMKAQEEALKGLAPAAGDFVKAISSLKGEWDDLTKAVQQRLFKGLGDEIRDVAANVLPILQDGLSDAAGVLNDAATATLKWIDALAESGDLGVIFDSLNGILAKVVDAVGGFGRGLFDLFQGSLPFASRLADSIKGIGDAFADWASGFTSGGGLDKFLERAWDAGSKLWDVIKNVGSILGSLFSGSSDLGSGLLQSLDDITKKFADFLKSPEGQDKMATFFAEMGEALGTIADAVKAAWPLLKGLLEGATVNQGGIQTLVAALVAMGPALEAIGFAIGILASTAGIFTIWAKDGEAIKEVWGGMGRAIVDSLSGIGEWAKGAWDALSTGAQAAVQSVADWFTGLPGRIGEALSGLAGSVEGWFSGVGEAVSGVVDSIAQWFADLPERIVTAAGDLSARFAEWLADLPVLAIEAVTAMILAWVDLAGRIITAAGDLVGGITQWFVDSAIAAGVGAANIIMAFVGLADRAIAAAGDLAARFVTWLSGVPGAIAGAVAALPGMFTGLADRAIAAAGSIASAFATWVSGLPAAAAAAASAVAQGFSGLAGKIITSAGNLLSAIGSWFSGLPGAASKAADSVAKAFSGLASKIIKGAGDIVSAFGRWFSGIGAAADKAARTLVDAFRGLGSKIVDAIGTIVPKVSLPKIGKTATGTIAGAATGTIAGAANGIHMTRGPEVRIIGERGPEAVVPLNPNGTLDRSVRSLLESVAAARGLFDDTKPSKQLPPIQVLLPTGDPEAAAMAVHNRLAQSASV